MNERTFELAQAFVGRAYAGQAQQARKTREKLIETLLTQRRLPDAGWDDPTIELFLAELATMDSNNFIDNIGVGEREARVYSSLVRQRHFHFGHGIGRSGDIAAVQVCAVGGDGELLAVVVGVFVIIIFVASVGLPSWTKVVP